MATRSDIGVAATPREQAFLLHPIWWLGLPLAFAVVIFGSALFFTPWHWRWLMGELAVIELAQLLALVLALAAALRLVLLPRVQGRRWLRTWLVLAVIGCIYTIGEEASYGQHIFGWQTPEDWRAVNQQDETNLHNVDNWFDMKPRLLLELGAVFGGIIWPIAAYFRPSILRHPAALIMPTVVCLPSALLAELSKLAERVVELMALEPEPILGFRANETQELYLYFFVLFYLLALGHKIRNEAR